MLHHLKQPVNRAVRFTCDDETSIVNNEPEHTQSDAGPGHNVLAVTVVKHEWQFAEQTANVNQQTVQVDAKMTSIQYTAPMDTLAEVVVAGPVV